MFQKLSLVALILSFSHASYTMLPKNEKQRLRFACFRETSNFLMHLQSFPLERFFDVADLATQCGEGLNNDKCTELVEMVEELTTERLEECPRVLKEASQLTEDYMQDTQEFRILKEKSFLWAWHKHAVLNRKRMHHDELYELNNASLCLNYDVCEDKSGFRECLDGKTFVCTFFLDSLKSRLKDYEDKKLVLAAKALQNTVLTYHAYFPDAKERESH